MLCERIEEAQVELNRAYIESIAERIYSLCPERKQEEGDAFALLIGIYIGSTEHVYKNDSLCFKPIEERIHQIRIYQYVTDVKGVETLDNDIVVDIVQDGNTYGVNLGEMSNDELYAVFSFLDDKTDEDLLTNYQIECL